MESATTNSEDQRPGMGMEGDRTVEDPSGQRLTYTIPGVLHFLQTECARMEAERAQFELERTEYQARIAFLEGERRAQDNLKKDLVRRIRMLELALEKERQRSNPATSVSPSGNDENQEVLQNKQDETLEVSKLGLSAQPVEDLEDLLQNLGTSKSHKVRAQMISEGRQLLRKYLQEIGYADTIVDVRSARVRALLGLEPMGSNLSNKQSASFLPNGSYNAGPSPNTSERARLAEEMVSSAEQSVVDTFSFLRSENSGSVPEVEEKEDITASIPELKKFLRPKKEPEEEKTEEAAALDELNGLLNNTVINTYSNNNSEPTGEQDAGSRSQGVRPEVRFFLRSHYDCVRSIAFHPTDPVLLSASDDTTVKIWALDRQNSQALTAAPNQNRSSRGAQQIASIVVNDLEPIQTFRGQNSSVLCTTFSSTGDRVYSGALDGSLACYSTQSFLNNTSDIYDPWNSLSSLAFIPQAHNDSCWDLASHPTRPSLLASCGADGGIHLWNVGDSQNDQQEEDDQKPNSPSEKCSPVIVRTMKTSGVASFSNVDFSRVEYMQLIAATDSHNGTNSSVFCYDFETGHEVARVESICPGINQLIAHPTLPLVILGCEDGYIRVVDIAQAASVHPAVPLLENVVVATLPTPASVSSVAIDQSGVYLLAGCHDGSVRLWNLETRACLFDDTVAHHKKFDEGVLSVSIHPSRPLFASSGADGAVRVYRW